MKLSTIVCLFAAPSVLALPQYGNYGDYGSYPAAAADPNPNTNPYGSYGDYGVYNPEAEPEAEVLKRKIEPEAIPAAEPQYGSYGDYGSYPPAAADPNPDTNPYGCHGDYGSY